MVCNQRLNERIHEIEFIIDGDENQIISLGQEFIAFLDSSAYMIYRVLIDATRAALRWSKWVQRDPVIEK